MSRDAVPATTTSRMVSPLTLEPQAVQLLNLALLSAGAGVWEWNYQEGLRWSDEVYRMFGLVTGEEQITFDSWERSIHPDDLPALKRQLETATVNKGRVAVEYRIILPSGATRWIYDIGDVYSDARGVPQGRTGICFDITERKAAEEEIRRLNAGLERRVAERTAELTRAMTALQESEERYRAVVEDQTEVICRLRPIDGMYNFVNDVFCRFFGKTREELRCQAV